jgi:hypothetical protein
MSAPVPEKFEHRQLPPGLMHARCVHPAQQSMMGSGIEALDSAFAGSVRPGNIIEWGIPQGRNGRLIPLLFLRHNAQPTVWIYGAEELQVYAPAWASFGVDLENLFFIRCREPVKQLRPLFLDNSFRIIVLDGPEKLSRGELAFISQQARHNGQLVFLIRNYFLSAGRGTAVAASRVNCWRNGQGAYSINFIKGRQTKKISLDATVVLHHGR